jgi:hypothetical protein
MSTLFSFYFVSWCSHVVHSHYFDHKLSKDGVRICLHQKVIKSNYKCDIFLLTARIILIITYSLYFYKRVQIYLLIIL